jgi:hypothetical protein
MNDNLAGMGEGTMACFIADLKNLELQNVMENCSGFVRHQIKGVRHQIKGV